MIMGNTCKTNVLIAIFTLVDSSGGRSNCIYDIGSCRLDGVVYYALQGLISYSSWWRWHVQSYKVVKLSQFFM